MMSADAPAGSPRRWRRRASAAPARPCRWAPSAAASSGSCPRAIVAPMTPDRTSPLPAVARVGVPDRTTRTRPSRSLINVVAPFNSTTHSVSRASARTASRRFGRERLAGQSHELAFVGGEDPRAARSRSSYGINERSSPSASSTTGTVTSARRSRSQSTPSAPRPGPATTQRLRGSIDRVVAAHDFGREVDRSRRRHLDWRGGSSTRRPPTRRARRGRPRRASTSIRRGPGWRGSTCGRSSRVG